VTRARFLQLPRVDALLRRILIRAATPFLRVVTIVTVSRNQGMDAIYAMHARWLTEVLGPGDSLFTPGTAIWTKGHLDELERVRRAPGHHAGQAARGKAPRPARGRLAGGQAADGGAACSALPHDLGWAISAATKVSILNAILAWMPAPPDVPADVVQAMAPGLVPPWYLGHDAARHTDHLADPVLIGLEGAPRTTKAGAGRGPLGVEGVHRAR
jgi:hypothetical protein